jgi:hypothetical protein
MIPSTDNVYLIFKGNGQCLYVGKSKDIHKRIREHLEKNNKNSKGIYSTSSKIENVYSYLGPGCNKRKILKIATIEVDPSSMYGAVEGYLIQHYWSLTPKEAIWNIKE